MTAIQRKNQYICRCITNINSDNNEKSSHFRLSSYRYNDDIHGVFVPMVPP